MFAFTIIKMRSHFINHPHQKKQTKKQNPTREQKIRNTVQVESRKKTSVRIHNRRPDLLVLQEKEGDNLN